jgi:hypothetical protein
MRFDPARVGVVAVGIEAYGFSDKNLNLNGPARHAVEFVKLAKDAGVKLDKVRLFLSVAVKNSLDKALEEIEIGFKDQVRNASNDLEEFLVKELPDLECDLLYFYWCGHGAIDGLDRRLFYADANDVRYHNLGVNELLQYLHSSKFKHRAQVGFVDACAERVDLEAERLKGPTALWVGKDQLTRNAPSQFFYYAAAPWNTAQSTAGTAYFSRAVLDVLCAEPKQLLQPRPDGWRDAITARFKELWPKEADDFRPVSFLEFADGHVRTTVLVEGFNTREQDEIRQAAEVRGWSMEMTVIVVKELAALLGRREADFNEKLCARFRQITGLAASPKGSVVRLVCGAMLEKKLEAFLAALRELSQESASAQALERLCQHADEAAWLRPIAQSVGWSLARWQALYTEWMDRDVPPPQTLELLLFESLNSYAKEDGAGVVYLAERAAQETARGSAFLKDCRNRWSDAVPIAAARLASRRQGNQNYITLEISSPRRGQATAESMSVERAWFQGAGDAQPRQADPQMLADRQRGKANLGERMYSVVRKLRTQHFKQVDDALIVLEVIVDAPLLLFDRGMFQCDDGDLLSLYNVALRWRDRLDPGEAESEARENWEELAGRTWAQVLPTEKVKCVWLGWDEKNMVVRVRDHIQEAVRRASPRPLLVGLRPDGDYRKLSRLLSASGAPFACWHLPCPEGAAADISTLLGETILEELPHALRKARLDPNGLEHLTILYDDPQRDPYRN